MMEVPKCPICYDIISEPVVYPCQHEVCKGCFERSMETANLWCPLCRKRVSSWARRNFRNPVDAHRRKEIQKVMASPGFTNQDGLKLENETSSLQTCLLSKPGEIQQEYLHEVSKVREERNKEEKLGEVAAHKLLLDEEAELHKKQSKLAVECQLGYEAARLLVEEERRKEDQQLEEDQRMAELLSQEFILQQIENREKQASEDQKMAERLSKEMEKENSASACPMKARPPSKIKTPKRKSPVLSSPLPSPSTKPITFWLKPVNRT